MYLLEIIVLFSSSSFVVVVDLFLHFRNYHSYDVMENNNIIIIEYDELFVDVHLRSSQANTRRDVHGLCQVDGELLERGVENGYRRGHFMEAGIGVAQNVENGHWKLK